MSTRTISPLRQRMIDDMTARKLAPQTQHLHIASCKRFAAFLQRSPETATVDDICRFQLQLAESGMEIAYRNRIVTGVKFLFRVTLRRHDLAAEMYHLTEPRRSPWS
jgi:integrase/recombinase XerD